MTGLAFCVLSAACATVPQQACKTGTVMTSAEVTTSLGSTFAVETYYRTPDETAVRFLGDAPALLVVEGPFAWIRAGETAELGTDRERRFVLGHQFHALADQFDRIATDIAPVESVMFDGKPGAGFKGNYPTGGTVTLVQDETGKPIGLIMDLPDESIMHVHYSNWQTNAAGDPLAYAIAIEHEGNTFDYHYTGIDFGQGDRADFHSRYPAPDIPEITDFRSSLTLCA